MSPLIGLYLLVNLFSRVSCHTWIEQLSLVDQNGQPVGDPGFIRGYGQCIHLKPGCRLIECDQYREPQLGLLTGTTLIFFPKRQH